MPPVHGQGGEGPSGCLQLPKQRREGSALRQGRGSHYGNPASLQGQKPGRMAVGRGGQPHPLRSQGCDHTSSPPPRRPQLSFPLGAA